MELYSEESRRNILDAARTLFAEKGFAAATIRQIARNAGVSEGLIYHHFRDKTALLTGIIEDTVGPGGPLDSRLEEHREPGTIEEYLEQIFQVIQDSIQRDERLATFIRIMLNSLQALSQEDRNRIMEKIQEYFWLRESRRLAPILENTGLDPYYFFRFIHGSIIGYFLFQEVLGGKNVIPMDPAIYRDHFITILSRAARPAGRRKTR